jgi:hypothetical protein
MGTHLIPRDVKGEARVLIIFTQKGFFYTLIGIGIGGMIATPLFSLGASVVAWGILALFAGIGFVAGQVKIPDSNAFDILKKTGGEHVDEVVMKAIKFRRNRKIYTYDKGGRDNVR